MTTYYNSSLNGHYWFRKVGGIPNTDALGTISFDGNGKFSGTFILNVAGAPKSVTYNGTYQVNHDGSGTFSWVRQNTDGSTESLHSHIIAIKASAGLITQVYSSIDEPDPATGELSGRMIYRQPD